MPRITHKRESLTAVAIILVGAALLALGAIIWQLNQPQPATTQTEVFHTARTWTPMPHETSVVDESLTFLNVPADAKIWQLFRMPDGTYLRQDQQPLDFVTAPSTSVAFGVFMPRGYDPTCLTIAYIEANPAASDAIANYHVDPDRGVASIAELPDGAAEIHATWGLPPMK